MLKRNQIISDHAYGVLDPRFERLLEGKDTVYKQKHDLDKEITQHARDLGETRMNAQITTAREMLKSSPELLASFEMQVANDPAGAVAFAAQKAGEYKALNTVADLKARVYRRSDKDGVHLAYWRLPLPGRGEADKRTGEVRGGREAGYGHVCRSCCTEERSSENRIRSHGSGGN